MTTQLQRIQRLLPRALWLTAADLAPEPVRRFDCARFAACHATFAGARVEVPWCCPANCPDYERRSAGEAGGKD